MATDAWMVGKAMALTKKKTAHGEFTSWKRKWGYSDATVSRYVRLYEAHKTPDVLRGKEIMDALRECRIVAGKTQSPKPVVAAKAVQKRPQKERPQAVCEFGTVPGTLPLGRRGIS